MSQSALNDFMALGQTAWREARQRIQQLLSIDCSELQGNPDFLKRFVRPAMYN